MEEQTGEEDDNVKEINTEHSIAGQEHRQPESEEEVNMERGNAEPVNV